MKFYIMTQFRINHSTEEYILMTSLQRLCSDNVTDEDVRLILDCNGSHYVISTIIRQRNLKSVSKLTPSDSGIQLISRIAKRAIYIKSINT